jgi:hypothetical protein
MVQHRLSIDLDTWWRITPEARRMIRGGCLEKSARQAKESTSRVKELGRRGVEVRSYRCPFTMGDAHHWHVGHPPTMTTVEAIASTIRDLHGTAPEKLHNGG